MENKNISKIALERIIKEGIKPISRKVFSLKRVMFWTLVISSIIVGSVTVAIILTALLHNDWYLFNYYGFSFILKTLPYFWLTSLVILMIVGEYYYRQTLLGYRRSLALVVTVYLSSTILAGSIFYLIGVGGYIEDSIESNMPNYRSIILNRNEFWSHPEEGLLSGEIIRIRDDEIEIMDFDGFNWIIKTNNSLVRDKVAINIGERIKILGNVVENNLFQAKEIRSWINIGSSK